MEVPGINERIKYLIDNFFDGSENAFSKAVGVSQGTINRLFRVDIRYNAVPIATDNTVTKIINSLGGVSKEWLTNGMGKPPENIQKMYAVSDSVENVLKDSPLEYVNTNDPEFLKKKTPFYDIDFYSGFDAVFNDQSTRPSYYFYHPDFIKADFAVRNSGNSMSEIIGSHDIVGLKQVNNWQEYFPEGEIYALITSNDLRTIKHVKKSKDKSHLILIPRPRSDVKHLYPDFEEIPLEMVINLFQVVASMDIKKLAL